MKRKHIGRRLMLGKGTLQTLASPEMEKAIGEVVRPSFQTASLPVMTRGSRVVSHSGLMIAAAVLFGGPAASDAQPSPLITKETHNLSVLPEARALQEPM